MFEYQGGMASAAKNPVPCTPDYEKQISSVKARLDSIENLKKALFDFLGGNDSYRFNKITSLAEFIGGIEILKREEEESCKKIMQLIEEESPF